MPLDYLSSLVPSNIESIFMVILIIILGLFLGSMANRAVNLALSRTKLEGLASAFLARAARIAIYLVAVISALGTLGVDTTITAHTRRAGSTFSLVFLTTTTLKKPNASSVKSSSFRISASRIQSPWLAQIIWVILVRTFWFASGSIMTL